MAALLRAVRTQHGMTLDDLAAETGLTKSYLSKVERRQSNPSIAAALKIARALDVDVAQLFSDDASATSITVERRVTETADRHHPIAAAMLGKAMSPFVVRPGRQFTSHAHPSHPGQEFLFVHAGQAELSYRGEILTLAEGDCAYIDATVPHKLRQSGDAPTVVIVVACNDPRATRH